MPAADVSRPRPLVRPAFVIAGAWTALGLIESAKAFVNTRLRGIERPWGELLLVNMPWWYTWALLTPAVIWVARRVRVDGGRWPRGLALHLAAGIAASALHLGLESAVFYATVPPALRASRSLAEQVVNFSNAFLMTDLLTYGAIVGSWFAFDYYRRYRESALASARLEAQRARLELGLAEARIQALRMELNPHFLFNTLNAISGLVRREESAAAVQMLAGLGDLLRATLDREMAPEIPVAEELRLLERYLDIERVRFGDRLTIAIDVAPDAADALVPALVLQPLVENAVRHGVGSRPGKALVRLAVRRSGGDLQLEVCDSGQGLGRGDGRPLREGVGLSNTRARLAQLYGGAAALWLGDAPGGGACVGLTIPYHVQSGAGSREHSAASGGHPAETDVALPA